jgi:hypothetical protein
MTLQDIKDVLTFASFRPEPDDPTFSWKRRFSHRRSLLLSVAKNRINWKALAKGGKLLDGGLAEGEYKEIITHNAAEWKRLSEDGLLGISLNTRYVISLEINLTRRKGAEDLLQANPRAALGSRFEKGKRYAVTHNPESNTSLLLTAEEEFIKKLEGHLKENGLAAARVACGTYAMLRHLLVQVGRTQGKGRPNPDDQSLLYIVLNDGAVAVLLQIGEQWIELRSRPDVWQGEDTAPVLELLKPFQARLEGSSKIFLLGDQPRPHLTEQMKPFFAQSDIEDFSEADALWRILRDG